MDPLMGIGSLKSTNDLFVQNELEGQLFNNRFHSVCFREDNNASLFAYRTNVIIPTSIFSRTDIKKPFPNQRFSFMQS